MIQAIKSGMSHHRLKLLGKERDYEGKISSHRDLLFPVVVSSVDIDGQSSLRLIRILQKHLNQMYSISFVSIS